MKRNTFIKAHITATLIAGLTISTFLLSTITSEISGNVLLIQDVKKYILYGIPLLIISMPMLAITGKQLAGKSNAESIKQKMKRMKMIAVNGMFLIILAVFLYLKTREPLFDFTFWTAQSLEIILGTLNLFLIGKNIQSGFKLSGKFTKRKTYR